MSLCKNVLCFGMVKRVCSWFGQKLGIFLWRNKKVHFGKSALFFNLAQRTWLLTFKMHYISMTISWLLISSKESNLLTLVDVAWPLCRPVVPGCARCAMAHPYFGRSVDPISTRGDRLCTPNYYWHIRIFRPSEGPAELLCYRNGVMEKITANARWLTVTAQPSGTTLPSSS